MNLIKSLPIALAFGCLISTASFADSALVKKGEKIFKTKKLANCVACHDVNGKADIKAMGPGSMGPKLQNLSAWPEKALYEKIYNPYTTNPVTQMPAFGKSGWLSDSEIKALVAYLKTVN